MSRHTIHVISHTHWDREWYMPFERHRRRLVTLFDNLLDLMDADPDFRHFHADGQIIPLDDYLEIRPQALPRIQQAAAEGRLSIGPWYVLQDEFLTSGEANVRNMALGLKRARLFGTPCLLGYLPDSFGNIGQMPQILRGFGIDNAVFGRGINSYNPDVDNDDPAAIGYKSEFTWRAPDGSEVLGVFMANWYANAMTIPSDEGEVKAYVDKTRDACLKFATTSQLLFMNGCDHTPSQPDISTALRLANAEVEDAELVHSSFDTYLEALRGEVKNLQVKEGEMRSEYTDGWGTLTNVLSSRLYQKRANWECQTLLEKGVEPLGAFAAHYGGDYDEDMVWYAWKTLMQNHPHDSICGCSCDEVHREMDTRFEKCAILAKQLCSEHMEYLANQVDTSVFSGALTAVVAFNPLATTRIERLEVDIDLPEGDATDGFVLRDASGNELPTHVIEDYGVVWDYDLPDVGFRQPYDRRRVRLVFEAELSAGGLSAYGVFSAEASAAARTETFENKFLRVELKLDGRFDLVDKVRGRRFCDHHRIENSLDCGDEYNYRIPEDDEIVHAKVEETQIGPVVDNGVYMMCRIETVLQVRGESLPIAYELRLGQQSRRLEVRLSLENVSENHRLRLLFPTDIKSETAVADGQFDQVARAIIPSDVWKNPSNCHPQQAFVAVDDGAGGLLVANRGLPEYEILQDGRNTIALTALRAVDRLGDWGVFPTPEAQCKGAFSCEYALVPYGGERAIAAAEAYAFNAPAQVAQTALHGGGIATTAALVDLQPAPLVLSACKKADGRSGMIVRFFNPTDESLRARLTLGIEFDQVFVCDLAENRLRELASTRDGDDTVEINTGAKEIVTLEFVTVRGDA